MRKAIIAACAAICLLIAAAVTLLLLLPRRTSSVNEANTARVQLGMTQAAVEEIFGGPPGDYRVGSRAITVEIGLAALPPNTMQQWRGDDGLAMIEFGPDGLVRAVQFVPTNNLELSLLDRVLALFGL